MGERRCGEAPALILVQSGPEVVRTMVVGWDGGSKQGRLHLQPRIGHAAQPRQGRHNEQHRAHVG